MDTSERKLIQDVITRWNSSYFMFERLLEEYQAVNTALCMMDRSELCLSTQEVSSMREVVTLLKPFEEVTRELSSDSYVSFSKIIPIARGLQRLTMDCGSTHLLKHKLLTSMRRRYSSNESNYMLAASTLLDPRFKKLAFGDSTGCNQAVQRITTELAAAIQQTPPEQNEIQDQSSSYSQNSVEVSTSNNVWSVIDERVAASISTHLPTASSISMLRIYFEKPNLIRTEDPLVWWNNHLEVLPFLSNLAMKFLSVPGHLFLQKEYFLKLVS